MATLATMAAGIQPYGGVPRDRQMVLAGSTAGGGVTDAAGITRDQWQHFLETYRPVESDVLASATKTDFSTEGDDAGAIARGASRAAQGTLARNLSRAGVSLSPEERSALARRQRIGMTQDVARAENTTRRTLSDSRTNLLADIVGLGRGVARTASGGLQNAADMAAQRQALYDQQKEQTRNANLSMAAQAAALLFAI